MPLWKCMLLLTERHSNGKHKEQVEVPSLLKTKILHLAWWSTETLFKLTCALFVKCLLTITCRQQRFKSLQDEEYLNSQITWFYLWSSIECNTEELSSGSLILIFLRKCKVFQAVSNHQVLDICSHIFWHILISISFLLLTQGFR